MMNNLPLLRRSGLSYKWRDLSSFKKIENQIHYNLPMERSLLLNILLLSICKEVFGTSKYSSVPSDVKSWFFNWKVLNKWGWAGDWFFSMKKPSFFSFVAPNSKCRWQKKVGPNFFFHFQFIIKKLLLINFHSFH